MTSSNTTYNREASFSNTVILGIRASNFEFCRDQNIQPITRYKCQFLFTKPSNPLLFIHLHTCSDTEISECDITEVMHCAYFTTVIS